LLESDAVVETSRRQPWLIIAAAVVLAALLAYTLFAGYLPAKHRVARLERELQDATAREGELRARLSQEALHDQQLAALAAERDTLARRIEELERELAAARGRRSPPPPAGQPPGTVVQ
jgi:septal ring factor EnvC (AmiA/AmiB activator)